MYMDDMKKYIRPRSGYLIIGIGLLAFYLSMARYTPFLLILGLISGPVCIWVHFSMQKDYRKTIEALESSGEMLDAVADYPESQLAAKGGLRLGKRFLYARAMGIILKYQDITGIQMEVRLGKDLINVNCKDRFGGYHHLCTVNNNAKNRGDIMVTIMTIKAKNPSMELY